MNPTQPSLEAMLTRFLARELADPVAAEDATATGEVQPYLAAGFRIPDARLAFREGTVAATALLDKSHANDFSDAWMKDVSEWHAIVRQQQSILALPLAVGNFPQLVQDLAPLFQGTKGLRSQPMLGRPLEVGDLTKWGEASLSQGKLAQAIFASAALRLAGHEAPSINLIYGIDAQAPPAWGGMLHNERAAHAWHFGRRADAAKLWDEHPLKSNPAIAFNRGLVRLCDGRTADAEQLLKQAADGMSEKSAWHALAQLYRTLATMG